MPEIAESVISQEEEDEFGLREIAARRHHDTVQPTKQVPQISKYQSVPFSESVQNPDNKLEDLPHGPRLDTPYIPQRSVLPTESEFGQQTVDN